MSVLQIATVVQATRARKGGLFPLWLLTCCIVIIGKEKLSVSIAMTLKPSFGFFRGWVFEQFVDGKLTDPKLGAWRTSDCNTCGEKKGALLRRLEPRYNPATESWKPEWKFAYVLLCCEGYKCNADLLHIRSLCLTRSMLNSAGSQRWRMNHSTSCYINLTCRINPIVPISQISVFVLL